MSNHRAKFRGRATTGLAVVAIAAGVFFFIGLASQQPAGWGAAYAFGSPTAVQLPKKCTTETISKGGSAGRSTTVCEHATWTVDGTSHDGTLYAYADQIDRSASPVAFKGEPRVLGDRAYGEPEVWMTVLHLAALVVAALGLLGLLVSLALAAVPPRRR
ncbi:hypothetical protein ACGFX4_14975 [Kitasatospora sp. NPDC048365]|uniref:hypothetical protein n=1 Tax=Kitasatospora sp. NPDC048365 TaxID=3364050 RepID=UPI003718D83B